MRELLGGTEEKSLSSTRVFFTKRKQTKIELVSRPGSGLLGWDARGGGLTAPLATVWLTCLGEVSKGWVVSTDADTSDEFEI